MPPLISLILTTHNRAPYLPIAITSIRNQTYPHFELIFWDDGSTDDSLTLAQTYAQQDPLSSIKLFFLSYQIIFPVQKAKTFTVLEFES